MYLNKHTHTKRKRKFMLCSVNKENKLIMDLDLSEICSLAKRRLHPPIKFGRSEKCSLSLWMNIS